MNKTEKELSTVKNRVAYGMADIYGGGAFVVISTFFTVFLTKSLGMSPALAGTIPLIGKVWDAITDPLMGNIVDRTTSKFGAKRFYLLIGSIISAITFVLMWMVAPIQSAGGQYAFYVCMYMLFSTGFTIVMVPYNALLQDMIDDYVVRAKFSGTRMICSTFGAILAGMIPTVLIKDNTDSKSYFTVAVIFSVIFLVCILISFFGTWEKQKQPIKANLKETLTQSFTVFKCRSFRLFILIFLCGQGAADFVTGLAVYYVDDVLNAYSGGRFTYLMAVILLSQFVGTIMFSVIMPKTSKTFPILVGFPTRIIATIALLFFSYEGTNFAIVLVLSFIIGLGMAGSSTSIYALLADTADVDELITSVNRPGTCSAMATFVRKIVGGCSAAVIGLLLSLIGYDEMVAAAGGRQTAFVQSGITQIYVWAPTVLMVVTLVMAIIYPVTQKEFEIVRKEIARRKGEDSSIATPEEIRIIEKATGFAYNKLWDKNNAVKFSNK